MLVLKYICFVIAIFSTLLFISNFATSLSDGSKFDEKGKENTYKFAAFRLILATIMSLTWPVIFLF